MSRFVKSFRSAYDLTAEAVGISSSLLGVSIVALTLHGFRRGTPTETNRLLIGSVADGFAGVFVQSFRGFRCLAFFWFDDARQILSEFRDTPMGAALHLVFISIRYRQLDTLLTGINTLRQVFYLGMKYYAAIIFRFVFKVRRDD